MWFEKLMGFSEETPSQVRENIRIEGEKMTSLVNGKSYQCGKLTTPNLADLRVDLTRYKDIDSSISLKEIVGDVQKKHQDKENAGAFFQAASQFNLLEMVDPQVIPEEGVDIYEDDRTQGPACAIAAGAGTIYRNYFAEVNGKIGQTKNNQIDCLEDLGQILGNKDNRLWSMENGYALPTKRGLEEIMKQLQNKNEVEIDVLRQSLRIGIQADTQITLNDCTHTVTQAYCSALPVAYSRLPDYLWTNFARLVLEASYEATFFAALKNYEKTGNNRVFLTLVGGGVFGNHSEWIFSAIERSLRIFADTPLDIAIVSYGSSQERVRGFIDKLQRGS